MPGKNNFHYKKGRTEIDSDNDNKAAIRLAYLNTIMYWVLRILIVATTAYKILSGWDVFFFQLKAIEKFKWKEKSSILKAQKFFEYPFIRAPAKRGFV